MSIFCLNATKVGNRLSGAQAHADNLLVISGEKDRREGKKETGLLKKRAEFLYKAPIKSIPGHLRIVLSDDGSYPNKKKKN